MGAVPISRSGGPEVPDPGPGHAAIDVARAGVDCVGAVLRRGVLGGVPPFVPGGCADVAEVPPLADAHRRVDARRTTGELLLRVAGG